MLKAGTGLEKYAVRGIVYSCFLTGNDDLSSSCMKVQSMRFPHVSLKWSLAHGSNITKVSKRRGRAFVLSTQDERHLTEVRFAQDACGGPYRHVGSIIFK
jgi:hypothetical protein